MLKRPDLDPEAYYHTSDPALRPIATAKTLTKWRWQRRGPAFHRISGKVYYLGADVLTWFDAQPRIDPAQAA